MTTEWTLFTWLNADLTRVMITAKAPDWRWWRKRYVKAEVERREEANTAEYRRWHFVVGGDSVAEHDPRLASDLEQYRRDRMAENKERARLAKLRSPWVEDAELPPAKVVKR